MAQFARPNSNVTQTSFTGGFAEIDESSASDADFAYGANNTAATLEVGLSSVTDPSSSSGHTYRYRIAKTNAGTVDGGGNAVTVTASLYQGTTLIVADSARTATGTWTEYSLTLSSGQADSISDYSDLRLRFVTSASGGSVANRRGGAVSWTELEVPDAPVVTTYRGHAQSQARIKRTVNAFAQSQARIRQTYRGFAQAQSRIKQTYRSHAQALALISVTYRSHAQAQAAIKGTSRAFAQAQARVKQAYRGFAQAQSRIKQTYRAHSQAQAVITITSAALGQAQSRVKAVSRVYSQSQARIRSTGVVAAQARAWITRTAQGHSQAQARIKAQGRGVAQALGRIRTTSFAYAQSLASVVIKQTVHAQGAARIVDPNSSITVSAVDRKPIILTTPDSGLRILLETRTLILDIFDREAE